MVSHFFIEGMRTNAPVITARDTYKKINYGMAEFMLRTKLFDSVKFSLIHHRILFMNNLVEFAKKHLESGKFYIVEGTIYTYVDPRKIKLDPPRHGTMELRGIILVAKRVYRSNKTSFDKKSKAETELKYTQRYTNIDKRDFDLIEKYEPIFRNPIVTKVNLKERLKQVGIYELEDEEC